MADPWDDDFWAKINSGPQRLVGYPVPTPEADVPTLKGKALCDSLAASYRWADTVEPIISEAEIADLNTAAMERDKELCKLLRSWQSECSFRKLHEQQFSHYERSFFPAMYLNKAYVFDELENLRKLPANWDQQGAVPIDHELVNAAKFFVADLPDDFVCTPSVVPMTKGRVQLEWHRGLRSLEIEFESPNRLHYLKFDPSQNIEHEGVISPYDKFLARSILLWF